MYIATSLSGAFTEDQRAAEMQTFRIEKSIVILEFSSPYLFELWLKNSSSIWLF